MWYQQLIGDTDHFALGVTLYDDPHPEPGQTALDAATWGRLELWVNGRCLTAHTRAGEAQRGVEWSLHHFWAWASTRCVPLFNEEPFPGPTKHDEVASASDWLNASEDPPWTLSEVDEDRWYARRSEWRARHALRAAFPGAAAPHVLMRRLGDFIEFSWDNEAWPGTRPDRLFGEQRGVARVGARRVARVWTKALEALRSAVEEHTGGAVRLAPPPTRPGADGWSWLVPENVAAVLRNRESIRLRLQAAAEQSELVIPHSTETLLLRDGARLSDAEIAELLDLRLTSGAVSETLGRLRRPRPAPYRAPWSDGYDAALEVRDALGWGDGPAPAELDVWLKAQQVDLVKTRSSASLEGALVARRAHRPLVAIGAEDGGRGGGRKGLSARMSLAAALGVYLLDSEPDRDFGFILNSAAHWPTLARAKAFGAMLLMPDEGIASYLADAGAERVRAADVRALMRRYGTTMHVSLNHLNNLGLIDRAERDALLVEMLAA